MTPRKSGTVFRAVRKLSQQMQSVSLADGAAVDLEDRRVPLARFEAHGPHEPAVEDVPVGFEGEVLRLDDLHLGQPPVVGPGEAPALAARTGVRLRGVRDPS